MKIASWKLDYFTKHPSEIEVTGEQLMCWKKLTAIWRSNKLTPEQYISMDSMIHSPDKENLVVVEEILKTKLL